MTKRSLCKGTLFWIPSQILDSTHIIDAMIQGEMFLPTLDLNSQSLLNLCGLVRITGLWPQWRISKFLIKPLFYFSQNGELCLWDIEDGLCLQINVIPGNHSALSSIQVSRGMSMVLTFLVCNFKILYSDHDKTFPYSNILEVNKREWPSYFLDNKEMCKNITRFFLTAVKRRVEGCDQVC